MKELRKLKLRVLELVDEINQLGLADISVEFGRSGSVPVTVIYWDTKTDTIDNVVHVFAHRITEDLKAIIKDLLKILAGKKGKAA